MLSNKSRWSLWHDSASLTPDDQFPVRLHNALLERVRKLAKNYQLPITITMFGRCEAELPYNWTLPLAQSFNESKWFLDAMYTVNHEELPNPFYSRGLWKLTN